MGDGLKELPREGCYVVRAALSQQARLDGLYAMSMSSLWQKLNDLKFGQFGKELGQTLKDKEAMPLDLASFDSSRNMHVADLRKQVKQLDFTNQLDTLDMAVTWKGKYDD